MCGIIGIVNQAPRHQAAPDLYVGLINMQHRGKQGAGIVTYDGRRYYAEKGPGELAQAFIIPSSYEARQKLAQLLASQGNEEQWTHILPPPSVSSMLGNSGIGHTRYGTAGISSHLNLQPIEGSFHGEPFFLAHNGNLVNAKRLRQTARLSDGFSDTVVITTILSQSQERNFEQALLGLIRDLEGAFNFMVLYRGFVYAIRDRFGFHPLTIGRREHADGIDNIVASETCALDVLRASRVREVKPGEIVRLEPNGHITTMHFTQDTNIKLDIFEFIYFLRPDSQWYGVEAGQARYQMGRQLALEHPLDVDTIIPIADSGNEAALGYWEGLALRGSRAIFRPWGLFRPHFVSRTFIEPVQSQREQYLRLKFNPRQSQLYNRHIAVVDDSIVRGNTIAATLRLLKEAGVASVSMVVSSPPYRYPDFYGIDTYRIQNELLAQSLNGNTQSVAKSIARRFGLRKLGYLSLVATLKSVSQLSDGWLKSKDFYTGPFTGQYPAGLGDFAT
ncbi:TPA: hypothetical protein DCQ82_01615 [Candidatus Veblenbacteria bacterium]|nr:hypothetical protein [Candidatus Veblenbacteria bacterium]